MIGEIAKEHNIYIIAKMKFTDNLYTMLTLNTINFKTSEDLDDKVIVIDSISKHYSACGARIGLIASRNHEFLGHVLKFCQARLYVYQQ